MTKPVEHCYIGVWPACGCIRYVSMDDPQCAGTNAKEVARLIRLGYNVERITVAAFQKRQHQFRCKRPGNCPNPHNKARRK